MTYRPFALAMLATLPLALSGCGVIYSKQYYGSPGSRTISVDATKADVFANMGEPNAIYKDGDQEVFVYKKSEGVNFLGLYSSIRRDDTVVIMDKKGIVKWVNQVPVGNGMTVLSPPMLDATHPVHTDTLLFEPENYDVEQTQD